MEGRPPQYQQQGPPGGKATDRTDRRRAGRPRPSRERIARARSCGKGRARARARSLACSDPPNPQQPRASHARAHPRLRPPRDRPETLTPLSPLSALCLNKSAPPCSGHAARATGTADGERDAVQAATGRSSRLLQTAARVAADAELGNGAPSDAAGAVRRTEAERGRTASPGAATAPDEAAAHGRHGRTSARGGRERRHGRGLRPATHLHGQATGAHGRPGGPRANRTASRVLGPSAHEAARASARSAAQAHGRAPHDAAAPPVDAAAAAPTPAHESRVPAPLVCRHAEGPPSGGGAPRLRQPPNGRPRGLPPTVPRGLHAPNQSASAPSLRSGGPRRDVRRRKAGRHVRNGGHLGPVPISHHVCRSSRSGAAG